MTTLVIVEGATDRSFVEGIAEKLRIQCKVLQMRGNRPDKIRRLLIAYAKKVGEAVVLKDLHRGYKETTALIDRLKEEIGRLGNQGIRTQIIIIKRSVESWILAGLSVNNPEEILNPEEVLKEMMLRRGKHYIKSPEVYRQLAREIDVEKATSKSETFRRFIETLKAGDEPARNIIL
ncbi:MAG: hypothetical protein QW707_06400 [Candidatus Bathyarchaeia archaeon]